MRELPLLIVASLVPLSACIDDGPTNIAGDDDASGFYGQ